MPKTRGIFSRKVKVATIENVFREEGGAAIINNDTPGLNKRLNSGRFSVGVKTSLVGMSKSPRTNFGTLVSQAQEYPTYGEAAISSIAKMLAGKSADSDSNAKTSLSVGIKSGLDKMMLGAREAGGLGGADSAGAVIGGAIKSIGGVRFAAASSSQSPKARASKWGRAVLASGPKVRAYRDLNYANQIQSFMNFTQAATFSQSDIDEAGGGSTVKTDLRM
jgi:hypothetical protein